MRLWHEYLIPYLDNKRLLGQHRECCALRGKGWGKKHSTVDYVFKHHIVYLIQYHLLIIDECRTRGFNIDNKWTQLNYRGKNTPEFSQSEINRRIYWDEMNVDALFTSVNGKYKIADNYIYPEHNLTYLYECLENLQAKHANLINGILIDELLLKLSILGISS